MQRAVPVPLPRLLALLPRSGIGASVYESRWAGKGLPVPTASSPADYTSSCRWEVKKVKLTPGDNGKLHGRAYGVHFWKVSLVLLLVLLPPLASLIQLTHSLCARRASASRPPTRSTSPSATPQSTSGSRPSRPRSSSSRRTSTPLLDQHQQQTHKHERMSGSQQYSVLYN